MGLRPGSRLGPYQIVAPIGAGGMGEVYKATDTRLDRTVAIKTLPDHLSSDLDLRKRFEREARAVSSLNHPNICTLYDIGHEDGVEFMVMEYIEGETLADRLQRGSLPLEEALARGMEIADALDKAHRRGVVHRDLKPGNVIMTRAGVKLLDFGLAKLSGEEKNATPLEPSAVTAQQPLTQEGTILGTFQYMSPEQLEGKEVDARTDVFAFGAVLYEMVTGHKAFTGESQANLISAIMTHEPLPLSARVPLSPRTLDRVVRKCLAKDPDDRWHSLADVAHLIRETTSDENESPGAAAVHTSRQRRWVWAMAGALLTAILVLAFHWFSDAPARGVTTRFDIAPPEGWFIEPSIADAVVLALSPDGRRLVYEAQDAQGVDRLWLRPLDSLESRLLPGTEGGRYPFWSPDGRFIAFFADQKLKKLEVVGGRLDTLCAAVDGKGGTWNAEGVILFSPRLETPLMRVSDSGGRPQPATQLEEDVSGHYFPTFLPDGRRYLFQEIAASGSGIRIGSIDSSESTDLLEFESGSDMTSVAYASGQLLFMRDGVLMAQAFDSDLGQLRGQPVPVAEGVARIPPGWASFSISTNGTLAYVLDGGPRQTELRWLDREGRPTGRAAPPASYSFVSLSPDEARLAVIQWDGDWNLWFVDRLRGTSTLVPGQNDRHALHLAWSPDGSRIVFGLDLDGPPNLFMMSADGSSGIERLFRSPMQTEPADWSPDGRFIVFHQNRRETGWDIGLLPLEPADGQPTPRIILQTEFHEAEAHFSPDGKYLAYVSNESGRNEVYVARFPEMDRKRRISLEGGHHPRWSVEAGELFFLAPGGKLMVSAVTTSPRFEAEAPRLLFERPDLHDEWSPLVWDGPYDVTRDGQDIVMNVATEERSSQLITVVLNWMAELER
ncbi:MAG TPA: protein kinase [Vicinamibacteria bacterium]|nr:protein kinase [Vicinamibacteria bacterium]